MKKILMLMLVVVMLIPSAVYAEEVKVFEVGTMGKYRLDETIYQTTYTEEAGTMETVPYEGDAEYLKFNYSVSNATGMFDPKEYVQWADLGIEVDLNSELTLLEEGIALFNVYELVKNEDESYEHDWSTSLPIDGTYEVRVDTGMIDENGESIYENQTMTEAELQEYGFSDMNIRSVGSKVTITEPGIYFANVNYPAGSNESVVVIIAGDEEKEETEVKEEVEIEVETEVETEVEASPTNANVLVNGEAVSFNAYKINDNNYFKLRDLAVAVTGTEKQFEVQWDEYVAAINLVSGASYTSVGGEMLEGDGADKQGLLNQSKIYMDDEEIQLTAYTIDGNNFFKLRDVAQLFDIGVTWDGETQTIGIDTTVGYVVE